MKIGTSVEQFIGNTPLVELGNIEKKLGLKAHILAKLEYFNPAGSVKDRVAKFLIDDAEKRGVLRPGAAIVEPTSGNTGIGLAALCAVRGYRLIIVMPDSMSMERRKLMTAYGAELILTPGALGMAGAVAVVLTGISAAHTHSHLWGNILILLCACVTSLYMVWFKRLIAKYRITTVLRWLYCTAAIVALPFGLRAIIHTDYAAIAQHALFPTLFVLIVPTYLPNLMLNYALKTVQPTVSSIYTYLQPVLAIAISVAMGLDKLHLDTVIFALVIFTGVALVLRSYAAHPDAPASRTH